MTFSTPMKCLLALSLCILVGLSIFSPSPALAVTANAYGNYYVIPYVWDSAQPLADFSLFDLDFSDTISYHPVSLTDLNIIPVEEAGVHITATGDLKYDNGAAIATQDYVTLVCASVRSDGSIYNTYLNRVEVDRNGLIILDEDEICLGILDTFQSGNAGQIGGDITLEFDIPPNSVEYEISFDANASTVAQILDQYVGPFAQFSSSTSVFNFNFMVSHSYYYPTYYPSQYSTDYAFHIPAGTTLDIFLPIAFSGGFGFVGQDWRLNYTSDADPVVSNYVDNLFIRNVGTAADPELEYVAFYHIVISAIEDVDLNYVLMPFNRSIKWFGQAFQIDIVQSDGAVVSKLQQLLDYYSANPPEADDLKGQSDMQKELEEAAIQDAQTNLDQAGQAAAPGTVLLPDITITSSITSFTSALGQLFVGIPWLAGLIAFVVFSIIIRALLGR